MMHVSMCHPQHAIMNCEKISCFTKYYPSENISMCTQGIDTAMGSIFGGSDLGSNLA